MKRSMKKMTSILLAVVLIVGAFTAVPLSAGAAAETVEQILGDVDGDGEVTIADATLISRYNAQMIQFTDQQLLKADVDGDGEITVIDVTWVQRYLNEMKAPEGIGKLLSEVYTTKAIPVLRESLDSTETAEIRRYADQPNVPYMNVAGFYNQFYLF
ncbi:MAG: dockerin type I repeat-containing protein, partial [Ruminococcus sp.]|nr:dockerin type I repeat-containing protein [Ruminococcus sp.]